MSLDKRQNINDEEHNQDIDFSDIPPLTYKEFVVMKPARLRKQKIAN